MDNNDINREEQIKKENKIIADTLNRLFKEEKAKKEQEENNS